MLAGARAAEVWTVEREPARPERPHGTGNKRHGLQIKFLKHVLQKMDGRVPEVIGE